MQTKREFLKTLGLAAAVTAVPMVAAAETKEPTEEEKAEAEIFRMLTSVKGGCYYWARLDNRPGVYVRIPKKDFIKEKWMEDETTETVHICDPVKFLEAANTQKKDMLVLFSGYVKSTHCMRCDEQIFGV
jgi:hypothetical protein